jgi:hypothetical protein
MYLHEKKNNRKTKASFSDNVISATSVLVFNPKIKHYFDRFQKKSMQSSKSLKKK